MFVRTIASIPVPRVQGLVIALNVKNREYFMLKSNAIDKILSKLKSSIEKPFDDNRAPSKFVQYAAGTSMDEWEFYYSTDPTASVPSEFPGVFKLVLTGTKADAAVNVTDSKVFKVTHNFTNIPIYVVDKCTAAKESILRKVVKQLDKFMNQHGADFSKAVEKNFEVLNKAHSVFTSTHLKSNYCLRDVYIEPLDHDDSFATLTARSRHLNFQMLGELK